jgi:phosphatidylserine decarboxylase
MKIHKEGYAIVLSTFVLFASISIALWWFFGNIPLFIGIAVQFPLLLFVLRFFRVPDRSPIPSINKVYSPADGTIVAIEEVDEPEFLNKRCIQVSVFMSVWNVHINWFPFAGKVAYFKYHPGKFLVAWHPKSSTENERTTVVLQRNDGVLVLFRQIAGLVARRIVCYAKTNVNVEQFQQMGFIKFGSRVDVFLPLNAKILVELNQKVKGTITALAEIPLNN